MSCSSNTLTQLGSDTFVRANGALGSNWTTPIELTQAVTIDTNTAYGGNNGGNNAEAQWKGGTIPSDQYAAVQWEYSGALAQHFDLTFRRDTTNNFAYWTVSFTHNSTAAFLLDNNGTFEDDFTLSSALATGDKVRVTMLGTQYCVFRDTGSGYVLEHSGTLPQVLPTSGTVAGNPGFTLSAQGRVSNWVVGTFVQKSQCQITGGGFQDALGNPIANGTLTLQLNEDQQISSTGQIVRGVVTKVPLDSNGNISGTVLVWGNDNMSDTASFYWARVYTANGKLAWGPENQQVTGTVLNVSSWLASPAV